MKWILHIQDLFKGRAIRRTAESLDHENKPILRLGRVRQTNLVVTLNDKEMAALVKEAESMLDKMTAFPTHWSRVSV